MTCEKCLHYEVCEDKLFKNTDKACEKHFISKSRIAEMEKEIERLTAVEEVHRQQKGELRKEVERLQKYNTNMARKHYQDGVKDLFERLKERYWNIPMWGKVAVVFMEEIAKEMGCG